MAVCIRFDFRVSLKENNFYYGHKISFYDIFHNKEVNIYFLPGKRRRESKF